MIKEFFISRAKHLALLVVAGCWYVAVMPGGASGAEQQLVDPVVDSQALNITPGQGGVRVQVFDRRGSPILGKTDRGVSIVPSHDLGREITAALSDAFSKAGYRPVADAPTIEVRLDLERLDYTATHRLLKSRVEIKSSMRVTLSRAGKRLEKVFHVSNSFDVALRPNARKNSSLIGETLTDVLRAVFDSPEVTAFLHGE